MLLWIKIAHISTTQKQSCRFLQNKSTNVWCKPEACKDRIALRSLCGRFEKDPDFLSRVVTMDETGAHFSIQKQSSNQWNGDTGSRCPKKFYIKKSAEKVPASVLWDYHESSSG